MKILVADDDALYRSLLTSILTGWGFDVRVAQNGSEALAVLQEKDSPRLVILDWIMPGSNGPEVCRRIRQTAEGVPMYVILLTVKGGKQNIVEGMEAGADDYITKPFDTDELRVRLQAGVRILDLQQRLTERVHELENALANVKQLRGLLPICAWCHRVRDDQDYWKNIETYLTDHSDAQVTHSICPDCTAKALKEREQH